MSEGKLVLKGKLRLLAAASIGNGQSERSDVDLLRDRDGNPFIPITSLLGVLRHSIVPEDKKCVKRFWGYTEKNKNSDQSEGQQSAIRGLDLKICEGEHRVVVRDGIAIDHKSGIVENQKKYDYEVLEPGVTFQLSLEISYDEDMRDFCQKMLATIRQSLEGEKIHIGARNNNGLGKIKLLDARVFQFDWKNKMDVFLWLSQDFSKPLPSEVSWEPFPNAMKEFTLETTLDLKNSLIIRSYSTEPNSPDATHMQSGGKDIITGSAFKGAIRARAERILKTLTSEEKATQILQTLFGNVEENKPDAASKGKLRVQEIELPALSGELQNRIKIDRFTGGTIETALFDSMPLFKGNGHENIKHVRIAIRNYKQHEIGLILLVLKDLWTGDLAIGGEKNVGRGVFQGVEARLSWQNENATIFQKNGRVEMEPAEKKAILEGFVTALQEHLTKGNSHE